MCLRLTKVCFFLLIGSLFCVTGYTDTRTVNPIIQQKAKEEKVKAFQKPSQRQGFSQDLEESRLGESKGRVGLIEDPETQALQATWTVGSSGEINSLTSKAIGFTTTLKLGSSGAYEVISGSLTGSLRRISAGNFFFQGASGRNLQLSADPDKGLVTVWSEGDQKIYREDEILAALKNNQLDEGTRSEFALQYALLKLVAQTKE